MFLSSLLYYSSSSFTQPALGTASAFFPLKWSFLPHFPIWGSPSGFLTHLFHSICFFRYKRGKEHSGLKKMDVLLWLSGQILKQSDGLFIAIFLLICLSGYFLLSVEKWIVTQTQRVLLLICIITIA